MILSLRLRAPRGTKEVITALDTGRRVTGKNKSK
jgi:hypothetical protein